MGTNAPLLEGRERDRGVWEKTGRHGVAEEVRRQVIFSLPMIVTNVAYYSIPLISVMFAGHLGDLELAGATLANSWATVSGFTLMIGLSGGLETLCGQAYGAKMYHKMGIYLQASMITTISAASILSSIWWYTEPILIFLRQDSTVAHAAAIYMRHLIPSLFAYGFLQPLLRFLQTQSVVAPLMICSSVALILHGGIAYFLVYFMQMGLAGAAIAVAVSEWISLLMLALYVLMSKRFKETWQGLSKEAFRHVLSDLSLAIPSAVMICLEYWAFELLVLLAGLMPDAETSTSLIALCVNTETIAYMVTYGFSAAVSTRVANELGAGNVLNAKNSAKVILKLSLVLGFTIILLLVFGRNLWAGLFSSNPLIIKEFAKITPLLSTSILLDSAQGVLLGISRGCGWQYLVAWTNLSAFYIVGMPIALLLGFILKLYVKGLWIGLICGLSCQICTLLIIMLRTNWSDIQLFVEKEQPLLSKT